MKNEVFDFALASTVTVAILGGSLHPFCWERFVIAKVGKFTIGIHVHIVRFIFPRNAGSGVMLICTSIKIFDIVNQMRVGLLKRSR